MESDFIHFFYVFTCIYIPGGSGWQPLGTKFLMPTGTYCHFGHLLHMAVRLRVLLCAEKTVEDDFRFCWMVSPNVGQTHKENPNLVRIFYMTFTLNDIYTQYNKLHTRTLIHKNQFTSLCRGQKPASKMHQTCIWNTGNMQSIAGPVLASAVGTDEKITLNRSYRIFIVWRSPVSPVFWARILRS